MNELTAQDIMTREVTTIPVTATLRSAAQLLAEKNISGAPVVDAEGKLTGMLTEADILDSDRREAAIPRTGAFGVYLISEALLKQTYDDGLALTVDNLMTRRVITATPHTPITELMRLMVVERVNRLPVMDGEQLIGIVTRADVLRGLLRLREGS